MIYMKIAVFVEPGRIVLDDIEQAYELFSLERSMRGPVLGNLAPGSGSIW
jgi:hypothetical protein